MIQAVSPESNLAAPCAQAEAGNRSTVKNPISVVPRKRMLRPPAFPHHAWRSYEMVDLQFRAGRQATQANHYNNRAGSGHPQRIDVISMG